MGSTDSIPQNNSLRLNRDNWETYITENSSPLHSEQCGYLHLKNKMTGEELDEYSLSFSDQDDYINYLNILTFRNKCQNVVQVAHFNQEKLNQYCSLFVKLKVYIEHFPLRLCHVQAIPFPENLYVLSRALAGFKYLYAKLGHFHITQDLICINEEGIVKVWINSNLSSSSIQSINKDPQYNRYLKKVEGGSQNSMIWELLTILDQITNFSSSPNTISFVQYLGKLKKSHLSFDSVQRLLITYTRQHEIVIPQVFQSAIKVIREKKGIFDSQVDLNFNKHRQQSDFTILGNRFKESKVERVQSIKNSVKSNASESNRTFADKLKSFDHRMKKKANFFGKIDEKDSPLRQPSLMMIGNGNNQPFTERPNIIKQLSSSSMSFPQTQSLIALGPIAQNAGFPSSNSNSDIISHKKQKNPLTLSQSPVYSKPQTYFSQYLNQTEQTKIVKKMTLLSFGQNKEEESNIIKEQAKNRVFRDAPISQSLENSKYDNKINHKPAVTFTYRQNSTQNISNQCVQKSELSKSCANSVEEESNEQINSMPFSPPSVDKRSSLLEQAKPYYGPIQDKDQCKQPFDQALFLFNKREYVKQVVQSLCEKVNQGSFLGDEQFKNQKSEGLVRSVWEKISYSIQDNLEESQAKQDQNQIPQRVLIEKKYGKDYVIEDQEWKRKEQKPVKREKQWERIKYYNINKYQEQTESFQQYKQFQIDPDIVKDLLVYEKEEKNKKSKFHNKLKKQENHL